METLVLNTYYLIIARSNFFNASFSSFDMFGRTFLTAAVSNIYFPIFSINNSKLLMFVSLVLYKGVYLGVVLVVMSWNDGTGSMEFDWDCLTL